MSCTCKLYPCVLVDTEVCREMSRRRHWAVRRWRDGTSIAPAGGLDESDMQDLIQNIINIAESDTDMPEYVWNTMKFADKIDHVYLDFARYYLYELIARYVRRARRHNEQARRIVNVLTSAAAYIHDDYWGYRADLAPSIRNSVASGAEMTNVAWPMPEFGPQVMEAVVTVWMAAAAAHQIITARENATACS